MYQIWYKSNSILYLSTYLYIYIYYFLSVCMCDSYIHIYIYKLCEGIITLAFRRESLWVLTILLRAHLLTADLGGAQESERLQRRLERGVAVWKLRGPFFW